MSSTVEGQTICAYLEDPGAPGSNGAHKPIARPVPHLDDAPLPTGIAGPQPDPDRYDVTDERFRYWDAADALRRAADLWGELAGQDLRWHGTVGEKLVAALDAGEDFNAFYDRQGLSFFHGRADGRDVYSGMSPDVVAHELGHAVLDALRPELFDAVSAEPPAFHEAFGDISAMLTALQLPEVRDAVVKETSGNLARSSMLSRMAEQLGWAIRQHHPDAVDPDCLRNAANSFFYKDPVDLPPMAPASRLSSEPHSFSRVFSGAFLSVLAEMFAQQDRQDSDTLRDVSLALGHLLVEAVRTSPLTAAYFSQVAAHMIAADGGTHADALRRGFVRHGILSLEDATGDLTAATPPRPLGMAAAGGTGDRDVALARIPLPGTRYGLKADLIVHAAVEPKRFSVSGAASDIGRVPGAAHDRAAAAYVEDLFRRGHVAVPDHVRSGREVVRAREHATHEVRSDDAGLLLVRRHFDCGLHHG